MRLKQRRDPIPPWINGLGLLIAAILAFQSLSGYLGIGGV